MRYQSRPVDSGQTEIHSQLLSVLEVHLQTEYRKPISVQSHALFASVEKLQTKLHKPIILDSGCGTGAATFELARHHREALVIGVDKSSHRLALGGMRGEIQLEDNCLLVRMNLVDFWRLALRRGWRLEKHYLLYPNPWPKAKHLRRRWYGHPVFPQILDLGGKLELRCNWRVYAEEFQAAMDYVLPGICDLRKIKVETGLSLFEQKYTASGHTLYQCSCSLDAWNGRPRQTPPLMPSDHPYRDNPAEILQRLHQRRRHVIRRLIPMCF
jgi:tRNA G46 methylase TrmB